MEALAVPQTIVDEMVAACRSELPREACGLLGGGADGRVRSLYPLPNRAQDPLHGFAADEAEQAKALRAIAAREEILLATYHSHPRTPAVPSRADILSAGDPSLVHFIVSLLDPARPQVRAWRLNAASGRAVEVRWRAVGGAARLRAAADAFRSGWSGRWS